SASCIIMRNCREAFWNAPSSRRTTVEQTQCLPDTSGTLACGHAGAIGRRAPLCACHVPVAHLFRTFYGQHMSDTRNQVKASGEPGAGRGNGQEPEKRQMLVLVIEDNQDLAKLFCDLLEVMGCKTEMAFSAQSGLDTAKRIRPDLLFCDLRLPGDKNGLDLASELRADPEFAATPLFAITGYSAPEEDQRAFKAGFDRIFPKPIKFAQIQEVLNHYGKR